MSSYELAFIGGGNMAEAIVRGVLAAGLIAPGDMIVSDPAEGRRDLFVSLGLAGTTDNALAARSARRVLLAVKPQKIDEALTPIAPALAPDALVISIAAGVSTARIESTLGTGRSSTASRRAGPSSAPAQAVAVPRSRSGPEDGPAHEGSVRVVRVMPNTPMLVGAGVSGLVRGANATEADLAWAVRLFQSAGRTVVLSDEKLIDAVTAVSGSGPAYFFYLIEQMVAAGVAEGLSGADALSLATATCAGAAKLLAESGVSPLELRRRVTSPHGTTQAATDLLDARGVNAALCEAVRAAAARSRELGK